MYEASSFIRLLEIFGVKTPTIFPDIQIDTLTSLLPSTLK